ncbi:hypothetical protein AX15_000796 [Amanita polypyramis BW_CC]|nr:hypothetical protein AX15_000796 [Amanita polypyramis BW_CC]
MFDPGVVYNYEYNYTLPQHLNDMPFVSLQDDLSQNTHRVSVVTQYGPVTGGRTSNGAAVFLEVPYALPPKRFTDPEPLPPNYRYEGREYVKQASYAVQPTDKAQPQGTFHDNISELDKPTENPLFLNVFVPPSFPSQRKFPVKVYIHGGFLQFGTPHAVSAQAQYVSAERSEVWVNIAYRLSVFGFLASDKPQLNGNYGFKDQWLALEWVKSNIDSFGGDPDNIQVHGLSAGAHSVHQQLHRASYLPEGQVAPFQSAVLQSNAILMDLKTPEDLRPQFRSLCNALKLDPDSPDILDVLRDPVKVPWSDITKAIDADALGVGRGIFRGCLSSDWIPASPGLMERQRSGELARGLRNHGVKSIVVGEVVDEWYIYSFSNPISSPRDIVPKLKQYFPDAFVEKLTGCFEWPPDDADKEEARVLFGKILSSAQVHIPVRALHRDLCAAGFPVLRYVIEWAPEQHCPQGYVTHGTDRPLWAFLAPFMTPDQLDVTRRWLKAFYDEVDAVQAQKPGSIRDPRTVLRLTRGREIQWAEDKTYDDLLSKLDEEAMSLQINLSSKALSDAYSDVLNSPGINWAIFTYEKGTNDLKVQGKGNGGLEELQEEFSDGRIQYAFARVVDPNSKLPKFVQINWCGDGVPEAKKGLFHTHSSAVGRFLRGVHVVINARNEGDVDPAIIMSRVEAASGAKYTAQKEAPRTFDPIAPVGTNYKPVGKVDIAALRATPTPPPSAPRPSPGAARSIASAASLYGRSSGSVTPSTPVDAWPEENPSQSPTQPAASRSPVLPTNARPAFGALPRHQPPPIIRTVSAPKPAAVDTTTKKDEDKPVGSAYTPVSLPAPKKLRNPFAGFEKQQQVSAPPLRSSASAGGPKKLTWSERQAAAKKQAEGDEARSRNASYVPTPTVPTAMKSFTSSAPAFGRASVAKPTPKNFGAVGAAAGFGAAVGAGASILAHSTGDSASREVEEETAALVRIIF